jgi:hypothetical protein
MDLLERDKNLPQKRTELEGKLSPGFGICRRTGGEGMAERLFAEGFLKENEKRETHV